MDEKNQRERIFVDNELSMIHTSIFPDTGSCNYHKIEFDWARLEEDSVLRKEIFRAHVSHEAISSQECSRLS